MLVQLSSSFIIIIIKDIELFFISKSIVFVLIQNLVKRGNYEQQRGNYEQNFKSTSLLIHAILNVSKVKDISCQVLIRFLIAYRSICRYLHVGLHVLDLRLDLRMNSHCSLVRKCRQHRKSTVIGYSSQLAIPPISYSSQ